MSTMTATKHAPIAGDCVWNGKDIEKSDRWIRDLSPAHIAEFDKALQGVKAKGLGWEPGHRGIFLEQRLTTCSTACARS